MLISKRKQGQVVMSYGGFTQVQWHVIGEEKILTMGYFYQWEEIWWTFSPLSGCWKASPVSQLDEELRQNLKVTMQQQYQQPGEESITQAVDKLQQEVWK